MLWKLSMLTSFISIDLEPRTTLPPNFVGFFRTKQPKSREYTMEIVHLSSSQLYTRAVRIFESKLCSTRTIAEHFQHFPPQRLYACVHSASFQSVARFPAASSAARSQSTCEESAIAGGRVRWFVTKWHSPNSHLSSWPDSPRNSASPVLDARPVHDSRRTTTLYLEVKEHRENQVC
jgi:hypothetical protein